MENSNGVLIIKDENIENEDIQKKAISINNQLKVSPQVMQIASNLNIKDANAILEFGNEPAQQISKFADQILNSIKTSSVEDSGVMIKELTSIMKKFDKQDFEESKTSFLGKLFSKPAKAIDKMMGKYKTIGGEIDKIYTQLSGYKVEINNSNLMLENLYNQNFEYYGELEKYIAAGNMIVEKSESGDLPKLESLANNGEQINIINYENFKATLEMLKQRIYDLEMAKMVSLQTAPQIKMIQRGNYKLISKVHSAFIITIPVFKNGIIQAIALKKQKLVADSLAELDRTTNELLMKNAENIRSQSVDIAKLSGGTSVKIETLEKTWNTIMQGIEETRSIEDENKRLREAGIVKLHEMTEKLKQKSIR
ncbi:toxic anion resistance protein [Clostridium tagluense]|uniref:Toxic anion resistance protein n=1 Tax=Clostridium tagluense TaxID=360422 RepID=A0A401UNN3_9CLOT|nr:MULTISPECIES: toxic anion resistance protein [Clostridium]MBU3128107.1 toxic anion resistance protein [Clostridium tagluense]MBW9156645.1 toxic anion resistance protein [Clostridium tagluense]MBZ9625013.1 toxic anion resistance protein [Clostridium sp. FP2]MCB2296948.1 toxic anion resistance protein [Clostridium tagluense]MCB2311756.1 toxic anion resistance protein [Clostridium tagluense]